MTTQLQHHNKIIEQPSVEIFIWYGTDKRYLSFLTAHDINEL